MNTDICVKLEKDTAQNSHTTLSFLQSQFWASFKSLHGWSSSLFTVSAQIAGENYDLKCSVLFRSFARAFTLCYIPLGIELPEHCSFSYVSEEYLGLMHSFCKELLLYCQKNTLCIRLDLPVSFDTIKQQVSFNQLLHTDFSPMVKAPVNIQPPDTVVLDLHQSEEELLENMKGKWRYNIRLAEKKGVTVVKGNLPDIEIFYRLYEQTAQRDGIAIHSKKYYESLFSLADSYTDVQVSLYMAVHEGDVIASIITLFTKQQGVYVYGASSNEKRNLMSTYLLQWKAITDAKTYGCRFYDFYGIPPTDDENHPMHGLYRFKTGFGGTIVHRIGSIDYPVHPLYFFYIKAERLRNFWYKKIKKWAAARPS